MKILEAKNITFGYGEKQVLNNINLSVNEADFIGIIGPNGSGKTTLLKTLCRGLKPESGVVFFKGEDIFKLDTRQVAKNIALVPQDETIIFPFTVFEIVMMGRAPYIDRFSWEKKEDVNIVESAMKLADVSRFKDRNIDELSSGERQRVFIARALAQMPKVLLLDEPTSHLDINHQYDILELVKKLNENVKITVVMISHDINLASKYCKKLVLLKKGRVYTEGSAKKVIKKKIIKDVYGVNVNLIKGNVLL
ncbi:MAG: ABC transporter ATP-binding protein [Candidatus Firestonebacteria bacterium]|nr:ABC transporter ATP-binding protein [Candidatus Firestonebacteria bacterium]